MSKMQDLVNQTYTSKNNREYKILEYKGRNKKGTAYKHYYNIRFTASKNEYTADRLQIKNNTVRDLDVIAVENQLKRDKKRRERARATRHGKSRVYKRFDFKDKIVLGLDLSTTSTGWAAVKNGKILKYGSITFKNGLSKSTIQEYEQHKEIKLFETNTEFRHREYIMYRELKNFIKCSDIILIEDTNLGRNAKVMATLSELRGIVLSLILIFDKEYEILEVSKWRSVYNFDGVMRHELKEEAVKLFQKLTGSDIKIDDVAESVLIALAGEKILNENQ